MKNVKTQLQTFKSGYVGEERTPLTLTGEEPEKSTKQSNERTPMMPNGVEMENQTPTTNNGERDPMKPVIPNNGKEE